MSKWCKEFGERGEEAFPGASNLLEQDFTADAPNQKWLVDFTFLETREGWLFLAGVLDAYSCKIVGWAMSDRHNAELVKDCTQHGPFAATAGTWSYSSLR